MEVNDISPNRNIIDILLEDVAEKTKLGVVFVHKDEQYAEEYQFDQKINFCHLCETIYKKQKLARLCKLDHMKRGPTPSYIQRLELCHAGLFNISFPIEVDGEVIAAILMGQKKIIGRENESEEAFRRFIEDAPISRREKNELERLYNNLAPVSSKAFGYMCYAK